ncbi:ion channel [Candidatus Marsarchaeota archaeon]|nr:ion channel [Candidatus Marsarchaeota archaeon]
MNSHIVMAYGAAIVIVILGGTIMTYILGHNQPNFSQNIGSFITALYFTVTTLSTVGYGDIVPITAAARVFDIILILGGLGVFFSAVTIISSDFVNSRVEKLTGRISRLEKRFLRRHIVLIGSHLTNTAIAEMLKDRGARFVMVMSDKVKSDELRDRGYPSYVADSTSEHDMTEFNLALSEKVIVDLNDTSRTMYTAIVAKRFAGTDKIVVVATTPELEEHLKEIGIKNIINPATIAAKKIKENFL